MAAKLLACLPVCLYAAAWQPEFATEPNFQSRPTVLTAKGNVIDTCATGPICEHLCDTDYMVYDPDKCLDNCHEDISYIWDVFDSYCGKDLSVTETGEAFAADLCYDGFYCSGYSCHACESKCKSTFGLLYDIGMFCADCDSDTKKDDDDYKKDDDDYKKKDYKKDDDDYKKKKDDYYGVDKCASNSTEKCQDIECWCDDVCDIVQCPHCNEMCVKNEEKVWPIFERFCECGFCEHPGQDLLQDGLEGEDEDANLLHVRQVSSSARSCSCNDEAQYCTDLCTAIGYAGLGLQRCEHDCIDSQKLGGILGEYCEECHEDKKYYKKNDKYVEGKGKDDYHPAVDDPTQTYYEKPSSTTPEYHAPPPPSTTKPEYYEPPSPPPTTPKPDYYKPEYKKDYSKPIPYEWKYEAAKAKGYAWVKEQEAKGKAEAFKYQHPEYFDDDAAYKKPVPDYMKYEAEKAKAYAYAKEQEAKIKAEIFKYTHPEYFKDGKYYR